ncbi:MAG: hypothetical protein L0210_06530 [Rhodospirillales bacterium]|nr:hypothetical protein [Rhodospirillales bacterium]
MPKAIFVNLACEDLKRSIAFVEALGFSLNPQFTNDDAACVAISDTIYAMLHTPASFRRFTSKEIADAHNTTEALLAPRAPPRTIQSKVGGNIISKPVRSGLRHIYDLDA